MPRPWDNAPWRRKVMLGVLCGVLILNLYGAWLLSRHRGAALLPVEWQSRQAGQLLVALPAKWKVNFERGNDYSALTVRENPPYMGVTRLLTIVQRPLRRLNQTPQEFAAWLDSDRAPEQTPEPFDFLGQHGVLYDLPTERIDSEQGPEMLLPTLIAVAILPNGTAVAVRLNGPAALVPADRELLKQVAQKIKEVNAPGHGVAQLEHPKRLAPLVSGSEVAS